MVSRRLQLWEATAAVLSHRSAVVTTVLRAGMSEQGRGVAGPWAAVAVAVAVVATTAMGAQRRVVLERATVLVPLLPGG